MLTARATHSQMGKPLRNDLQVPRHMRQQIDHRIAFSAGSRFSAEYYNSAVDTFKQPCFRRYLEYSLTIPRSAYVLDLDYVTFYHPPNLLSKPERIWTLVVDGVPVSCFTNVIEAWLVMLGLNKFGSIYDTHLIYTDRTV